MSSSSLISTPSARRKASGQGLPPFSSTVAAFAHSTASAMPGGLASGFARISPTAFATARAVASATSPARSMMIAASRVGVRIGDPVVDAAAAQRLGKLARAVGGEHHERLARRTNCAALGNRDLEIRKEFKQQRLELVIGAVDFVHKQHPAFRILQNLQQWTRDQETVVVDVDLALAGLADGEKLALIVPLVERMRGVDALVALQPHQFARRGARRSPWRPRSCRRPARLRAAAACRAGWRGRSRWRGRRRRGSAWRRGRRPAPRATPQCLAVRYQASRPNARRRRAVPSAPGECARA